MSPAPTETLASVRHVILDRDGTLNREPAHGWLSDTAKWEWEEGALEALRLLSSGGIEISVVTNQSGIGRGAVSQAAVDHLHQWLQAELAAAAVALAGIYLCPHAPDAECDCRKPRPGLVQLAVEASGICAGETILIGDDERDLVAGRAAGVRVALVCTGKGERIRDRVQPDTLIFEDLLAAAVSIAGSEGERSPKEP